MKLQIVKELNKLEPVPVQKSFVKVDFSTSPLINSDIFRDKLIHIETLSDSELFTLLAESYETLFSDIFIKNNVNYLDMFTNSRFLQSITQVMSNVMQINPTTRMYCNKIVYDYLTCEDSDPYIKSLMLAFSKMVNRDIIPVIIGIGIPESLATELVMARYSSLKEMVNVKRLNFILTTAPKDLMTEQNIVWIYEKLFNKVTPLFEGIMFDVNREHLSEDGDEIYSYISLAILDILNSMTTMDIRKVLISYSSDFLMLFRNNGIRFSMRSLSMDYYRINEVVMMLQQEQVYLP